MEKESDSGSEVKVTGPKQHIVFQSSASESGNEAPSLQQVTTDKAVAGPSEVTMTKPKQHIVFQSSASESGNEAPSLQQVTTDKAVAGPSEVTMHLPAAKVRVHLYEKVRSSH